MSLRLVSRIVFNGIRQKSTSPWIASTGSLKKTTTEEQNIGLQSIGDEPIQMANPFKNEVVKCLLCKHNIVPDYKNVRLLSQFQSPFTGRVYGRHITGLCRKKQGEVELEIIKAQKLGLMPTYFKDVRFVKDPKLYDPEKPIRPHKY